MSIDDIEMQAGATAKVSPEYAEVDKQGEPRDDLFEERELGHQYSVHGFLYSFRKALNYQSVRDIQYTLQYTVSFLIAASIGYMTDYNKKNVIVYLLPLLAPLMSFDTVGGTMMGVVLGIVAFVPMCVYLYILQKAGMGYHNWASSTVLYFLTCFVVGYLNTAVTPRKITLLLPVVWFVTVVNTPSGYLPEDFIWQALEVMLMALAVDVGVSLTILPRFACLEVQDRFAYSLGRNEEVLELALQAMLSDQWSKAEVFICEANAIMGHLAANQEAMIARTVQAKMEPVALVRRLFRAKQSVFNAYGPDELRQLSAFLGWHVTALVHAAKHMHFNEYHAAVCEDISGAMGESIAVFKGLIRLLRCRSHNREHINAKITELKRSLDHMHAVLSVALRRADKVCPRDATSFAATLSEPPLPLNVKDSAARAMLFEGEPSKEANRMTFSYFLFHMAELIQTVENKFWSGADGQVGIVTDSDKAASAAAAAAAAEALAARPPVTPLSVLLKVLLLPYHVLVALGRSLAVDWQTKTKAGLRTALMLGVALIFAEVPKLVMRFEQGQWIMFAVMMGMGDNLGGAFYVLRNRFFGTLTGAAFSYFVYLAVEQSYRHIIALFVPFLLLCGLAKQNKQWSYFGSLSGTTAIIITFGRNPFLAPLAGDYSLLRIQENVIGLMLSLVCQLILDPAFASDLLKVNIVRVLQQLSRASSTVADAYVTTVVEAQVASQVTSAAAAATAEVVDSGDEAAASSTVVFVDAEAAMAELGLVEVAQKDTKIQFIGPLAAGIRMGIAAQPLLIEHAAMETFFWSKALPEASYLQLIQCERKVLDELFTIDRALLRISRMATLKTAEPFVLFGKAIRTDVTALLDQVNHNLALWSSQIRASAWHDALSSTGSDVALVLPSHVQTRAEHIAGLAAMDQSAKSIARSGAHFNSQLMKQWMDEIIPRLSSDEASLHHMYDILTAFNALFYASSHLAKATSELGNTVFLILLLERKKSHKPF